MKNVTIPRDDIYTARWYANHLERPESRGRLLDFFSRWLGERRAAAAPSGQSGPKAPDSGRHGRKLWYPEAETGFPKGPTRGRYPAGEPEGAIVHWTAGRPDQTLKQGFDYQISSGMLYFLIDAAGRVGQNFPLDRWGYHAGRSQWPGVGRYVHRRLVGIEVICPGELGRNHAPWFDEQHPYPPERVREASKPVDNIAPGHYYRYTDAQERALTELILWLDFNFPRFNLNWVLGHDEVSPGRKVDPGASLSMTMPQYRRTLKEKAVRWEDQEKNRS